MKRLIAVVLALVLALVPTQASAHGAHCGDSRNSAATGLADTFVQAGGGNVYDGIKATYYAPPSIHVETGVQESFIGLYPYAGDTGRAIMGVRYGTAGNPTVVFASFTDGSGNVSGWSDGFSGTSHSLEIRSRWVGYRAYDFYVNGTRVWYQQTWPDFTPRRAFLFGRSNNGKSDFLGHFGDHFDWAGVQYARNGTYYAYPSTANASVDQSYMRISLASQNVDFWDAGCG